MTNYYIEKNSKIVMFDTDKSKIIATLKLSPDLQGLSIKETERPIVLADDYTQFVFADTKEYLTEKLKKEKANKKQENQTAYEKALKSGVIYKNTLFDCDTLAAVRVMGQMVATQSMAIAEEETIEWFDYNYQPVTLTITEFMELAGIITLNTRRIETLNCGFNIAIENCESLEALENIVIDYSSN